MKELMAIMIKRPRRNRLNAAIRGLVSESSIDIKKLIYPMFVTEGETEDVEAMPGIKRYSLKDLECALKEISGLGITSVLFFGIPKEKDETGSGAYCPHGIVQNAVRLAKSLFPELVVITDICLCEYTSHGHCGVVENGYVNNDKTLELLAKAAVSCAEAGADIVAPSDMMDGHTAYIRAALDESGFENTLIMSYSVKYASAFYGPFREAAGSAPAFGDRKTYQMDCRNRREAFIEASLDIDEGADIIMVKPAMPYLDVLSDMRREFHAPLAAYQVSGEYAMIKAAAAAGYIDEKSAVTESLISISRAGADMIITYFAPQVAKWLNG